MAQIKDIYVYMDWQESDSPIQMGVLHSEVLRGKEVFSFENNTDWLTYKQFRVLDPDLAQFSGKQYLPADKSNFGMFLDSSPDRWGRMLMRRREAINARLENRPSRTLTEADYLLGIYDGNRMGALRFKLSPTMNLWTIIKPWQRHRGHPFATLNMQVFNWKKRI